MGYAAGIVERLKDAQHPIAHVQVVMSTGSLLVISAGVNGGY